MQAMGGAHHRVFEPPYTMGVPTFVLCLTVGGGIGVCGLAYKIAMSS